MHEPHAPKGIEQNSKSSTSMKCSGAVVGEYEPRISETSATENVRGRDEELGADQRVAASTRSSVSPVITSATAPSRLEAQLGHVVRVVVGDLSGAQGPGVNADLGQ